MKYYISIILLVLNINGSCQTLKQNTIMQTIQFIPKEFHEVKLGYYETVENSCSPHYRDEMRTVHQITINSPGKIISNKGFTTIIPVCAIYSLSLRRGLKYNHLSAKILHIKDIEESLVYTGKIEDKYMKYEYPVPAPFEEERERERMERVKEAQKYTDDELEQPGLAAVNYINVNLMEYVNVPLEPGKYEVWLSFSGLESNRVIVEIVFEE